MRVGKSATKGAPTGEAPARRVVTAPQEELAAKAIVLARTAEDPEAKERASGLEVAAVTSRATVVDPIGGRLGSNGARSRCHCPKSI
jgi:hypothetical protein